MMGSPAAAWAEGASETARLFYAEFLPEVRRVAGEELSRDLSRRFLRGREEHRWLFEKDRR